MVPKNMPMRVILALFVLTWTSATSEAQFLEKLEQAVRSQLQSKEPAEEKKETATVSSEGELPAPKAPATELPSANAESNAPDGSLMLQPSAPGAAPASILESNTTFTVPSPLNLDGSQLLGNSVPKSTDPDGRSAYLGLEAEELVGGGIGVRVSSVTRGSPAWKAGFVVDDRLLAVDGFAIANLQALADRLAPATPGQTVRFLVNRRGRNREVVAVLMDAGLAGQIASRSGEVATEETQSGPPWLGIIVNDLTSSFRNQFGIAAFRGAAVTTVTPDSPAAEAGIRAGDAIIEINGTPIESARDLMMWVGGAKPGQNAEIIVARGNYTMSVQTVLRVTPSQNASARSASRVAGAPSIAPEKQDITFSEQPRVAPAVQEPASQPSRAELEVEVLRLRSELEAAQQRLQETEDKLKRILETLE